VEQKTGKGIADIAALLDCLVVTRGAEGSTLWTGGEQHDVPAVKPDGIVDPTGCGDAYRAGLLYGISHGWGWLRAARLASVMGAIKIAYRGGQNHRPTREAIAARLREHRGNTRSNQRETQ
jgi:adenosine kinase